MISPFKVLFWMLRSVKDIKNDRPYIGVLWTLGAYRYLGEHPRMTRKRPNLRFKRFWIFGVFPKVKTGRTAKNAVSVRGEMV